MVNHIGEDAEQLRIGQWCRRHNVPPEAQDELLTILYGQRILQKENTHDSE